MFDTFIHEDVNDIKITILKGCSKCDEMCIQRVFVSNNSLEYVDCEWDVCSGLDSGGHNWSSDRKQEYADPDIYYLSRCNNCNGSVKDWFRHKLNNYTDKHGNTIHSESI